MKRSAKKRETVLLTLVLAAGVFFRVFYLLEIKDNPDFAFPAIDASYHDYWARGLITGNWAVPPGREDPQIYRYPFFRAPGYPYFLALVYRIFGAGYLAPRIIQMLLGVGSGLLAFILGKKWFGWVTGLLFSFLFITYWIFIYFEGELVGVSIAVTAGMVLMILLGGFSSRVDWGRCLLTGIVLGIFALFRPNVLLFLPVAAGWGVWVLARRRQVRKWPAVLFGLALGAAAAIAPVTIRNCAVGNEFVLISTNVGQSLAVGNNELSDGTTHLIPGIGDIGTPFDWPRMVRLLERQLGRNLTHAQASSYLAGRTFRFMREQPVAFLRLVGRKALLFWGPREVRNLKEVHFARLHSGVLGMLPLTFPLTLALALVGTIGLFIDCRPPAGEEEGEARRLGRQFELAVLIVVFVASYFLSVLLPAAAARYRVPIIPFLLLLGACGLKRIGEFALKGEWLRFTFWIAAGGAAYVLVSINYSGFEPSPEKWHYDLALAYTDQEDWENAVREYREAIKISPEFVRAYNNLGNIYSLRGEYEEAIAHYLYVLRLQPDLAQVHNNLGNAMYKLGKVDDSIRYFRQALRLRPDLVEAHNNLGVALVKLGSLDEAVRHYREALRYKPANITTHVNLASILIRLGKNKEAKEHAETALRLKPGYEPARRLLERLPSGGG